MKKTFGFFWILVISITLFSCENHTKEKSVFPKEKNTVLENITLKEQLGIVFFMKSLDNYLVVTEKNIDTQIQLIDKTTKEAYLFGLQGNGPGRFLQAYGIIPGDYNHFEVFDVQKRSLFNINIDSVINLKSSYFPEIMMKEVPSFPMSVDRLSDSLYVSIGLSSGLKRFTLIDKNGEVISMEGDLPEKKHKQTSDFVHAFAYYGKLTTNRKENKIAICTNYAGIVQFYDCKTNDVKLIKEHNLFLADYTEKEGNFAANAETRWGYLSIDSNDKYVFALYSGLKQVENPDGAFMKGNAVHVFDWNGNPVCKLLLNEEIDVICVDDAHLYGYSGKHQSIMTTSIEDI